MQAPEFLFVCRTEVVVADLGAIERFVCVVIGGGGGGRVAGEVDRSDGVFAELCFEEEEQTGETSRGVCCAVRMRLFEAVG